jgi:O-antigen biosynthesis protein WbqP
LVYQRVVKRIFDVVLSGLALILLSWLFLILAIVVYADDPGPVFFSQKRVGIHKTHFQLHKFRSMKMATPHDVPTHLLENPDQYITKVGRFLRKSSLDELPQIWDILTGKMSIVGPRPALWNQDDLIAERDKYGANDIKPGLTGWAQINGRDELEIPKKAKFDGDYTKCLKSGGIEAFLMDIKCFFLTIKKVLGKEGIVEGKSRIE